MFTTGLAKSEWASFIVSQRCWLCSYFDNTLFCFSERLQTLLLPQGLLCTYSEHGLLFPFRLDPGRPQWETLWQHSVLPAGWHSQLTQRPSGCPGAAGWGKVLPHPGPSRTLSKHPAGELHAHWLIHEKCIKECVRAGSPLWTVCVSGVVFSDCPSIPFLSTRHHWNSWTEILYVWHQLPLGLMDGTD